VRFPKLQVTSDGNALSELPRLFDLLGGDTWTVYRFLTQPNSDPRNLPFEPKPVFRINSNYLFGVEPEPSGWVQHHPELEGDTALSAVPSLDRYSPVPQGVRIERNQAGINQNRNRLVIVWRCPKMRVSKMRPFLDPRL
jgi:hypothetical protein